MAQRRGRGDRRDGPSGRIVAGLHPVREALRAGNRLDRVLVAETRENSDVLDDIITLARQANIPVDEVGRNQLDNLAEGIVHQGVVATGPAFQFRELGPFLDGLADGDEPPFLVLLDGVTDPHNLGAIARTAEGLGVHAVVIPSRRAAGVTPTVEKAAAGAIAHLPLVRVTNLASAIRTLKERGIWVLGLEGGNVTPMSASQLLTEPVALVVGAEGRGLSQGISVQCDQLVRLPMFGRVASYNASVAAALALYEVRARREGNRESA